MWHSRFIVYSLLLHLVAGSLLVFSLDNAPAKTIKPIAQPQIVTAVAVDHKQVEKELQRLKDIEDNKLKKQRELEKNLKELQQKKTRTEKQRRLEEKKLAEAKKKKRQEEANRKKEQKKIARLKKEQDEIEKKKRKAEQERKRLEKESAERKRKEQAEQKRRAEEKQRREAELAEEQRLLEAEQQRQDLDIINQYVLRIGNTIKQSFNITGLPAGLSCVLQIRMIAGGEVVAARVVKTSGNAVFDRRAENAVNKASPLPVPDNPRQFEKMRELQFTFAPQNQENEY